MELYKVIIVGLWALGLINLLAFGMWLPPEFTVLFWALPSGAVAGQAISELTFLRKSEF